MSLTLRPTHDLVYIKKSKEDEAVNGIIIPGSAKEKESIGVVVAIGPGKTYSNGEIIPLEVKEGDKVIYSEYAGQTFKVDGEELICMREESIYAVIG